jgi:hypothetical protein
MLQEQKTGEGLNLQVLQKGELKNISVQVTEKIEPDFKITPVTKPSELQKRIFDSWRNQRKLSR